VIMVAFFKKNKVEIFLPKWLFTIAYDNLFFQRMLKQHRFYKGFSGQKYVF